VGSGSGPPLSARPTQSSTQSHGHGRPWSMRYSVHPRSRAPSRIARSPRHCEGVVAGTAPSRGARLSEAERVARSSEARPPAGGDRGPSRVARSSEAPSPSPWFGPNQPCSRATAPLSPGSLERTSPPRSDRPTRTLKRGGHPVPKRRPTPHLVAGTIESAHQLPPQFQRPAIAPTALRGGCRGNCARA
jgi:hypothetical protein